MFPTFTISTPTGRGSYTRFHRKYEITSVNLFDYKSCITLVTNRIGVYYLQKNDTNYTIQVAIPIFIFSEFITHLPTNSTIKELPND